MSLYSILGVASTATSCELRSAYRRVALATHPDKGGSSDEFRKVVAAFEVLADENRRLLYDRRLSKKWGVENGDVDWPPEMTKCDASSQSRKRSRNKDSPFQKKRCCGSREAGYSADAAPPARGSPKRSGSSYPPTRSSPSFDEQRCPNAFYVRLLRLYHVLQAMPVEQRRVSIDSLSDANKRTFFEFVHALKTKASNSSHIPNTELCSILEKRSEDTSETLSESEVSGTLPALLDDVQEQSDSTEDEYAPQVRSASPSKREKPQRRGIESQVLESGVAYRARLCFLNIRLVTKFQAMLEVAIEHHILLTQIRQTCAIKTRSYALDCGKEYMDSVRRVLVENNVSVAELGLRARFCLELSGSKRPTICMRSPLLSLEETLMWRSRALAVRYKDWIDFRSVWSELLQHTGFERKPVSKADADAYIDMCWGSIAEHWSQMVCRKHAATKRKTLSDHDRLKRRFQSALAAVERHIDACSRAEQRKVSTMERLERERLREKGKWDRENWRHMTMDEILNRHIT